jgi:hypothetical protein
MKHTLVVTTINGLNHPGIKQLIKDAELQNYELILIGDNKTPIEKSPIVSKKVLYFDLETQVNSNFISARILPVNHYARKNLGYLYAAELGASWISETDDDNRLYPTFWDLVKPTKMVKNIGNSNWINVYKLFGFPKIWHRGIPINEVKNSNSLRISPLQHEERVACVQGLADGDPDIDAICRILFSPETSFTSDESYLADGHQYCPTNSQLTRWNTRLSLPLLYLPSTVPWRVSDIWRGLIAQRFFCISGLSTQFRGGVGYQDRNTHDLLKDFIDEFEVHSNSYKLLKVLESVEETDPIGYMREVYGRLAKIGLVLSDEIPRLNAWIVDVSAIVKTIQDPISP